MAASVEPSAHGTISRRTLLAAIAFVPVAVTACSARRPRPARSPDSFTLDHAGSSVRCLYYDRLVQGDAANCLAIVLIHGANADATQWFDIGLVDAVDQVDLGTSIHRIVAVAPDVANVDVATSLVVDSLLPAIAPRFAPGFHAVSGISRGAAVALSVARTPVTPFISVGLHSPAVALNDPIAPVHWRCWIDVGDSDSLATSATQTATVLIASGVDVTTHHWSGGHDRAYWRSHLPDYIAFHVDSARRLRQG